MHEFEAIEDAVITLLQPLKNIGLKTLETYSGQMNVEDMTYLITLFPCIYVIATGLRLEDANQYDKYYAGVNLIIGDRNIRGNVAAARGDGSSPGVYELLEQSRALLHRKKIITGWSWLTVTDESPLIYAPEKNICIYTATYKMQAAKQ